MGWLGKSILALVLVTPVFMAGPVLKERGLRPETFCLWYYLGCFIGIAGYVSRSKLWENSVAHPWMSAGLLLTSIALGAAVQILLFQSMSEAPNPGIPLTIVNLSAVIICVVTPWLYKLAPQVFAKAELDSQKLLGIVLALAGVALIVTKK
jgi:drug/metabolite transporter (DMT)-like permease